MAKMTHKRGTSWLYSIPAVFCLMPAVADCDNQAAAVKPPAPPRTIKVALLHPGRENDRGWNQLAYDALMKLAKKPGVTVKHSYVPNESNFKSDMRAFASQ